MSSFIISSDKNFEIHDAIRSKFLSIEKWIHEHPVATKVICAAAAVFGIGLIVAAPFTLLGAAITLGVTGALIAIASTVAFLGISIFVAPSHHDMKNHLYTTGECEGGRLYYDGDVPVLSLQGDDPFVAGKAQGYLCAQAIERVTSRFGLVLHTLAREPRAAQLPHTMAALRKVIPERYLKEMEGLVAGYSQWADQQAWWKFAKKLTLDDVLLLHLIPDSRHFHPSIFEKLQTQDLPAVVPQATMATVACTTLVEGDTVARNMDWTSLDIAGAYSLVIHRTYTNGLHNTVDVAIPALVGNLTARNKSLCLAMNVSPDPETASGTMKGMPACLYNRLCVEECQNLDEVHAFIARQSPLSEYHLTLADPTSAESVHFYQGQDGSHATRQKTEDKPLITLNWRYKPEPSDDMHMSNESRERMLATFFSQKEKQPLEEALSLRYVNNKGTTHRVVMQPRTGMFRVAFDNAFAGSAPLHSVNTENLLG